MSPRCIYGCINKRTYCVRAIVVSMLAMMTITLTASTISTTAVLSVVGVTV